MGVIDFGEESIETNNARDRLLGSSRTIATADHDRDLDPAQMANGRSLTAHPFNLEFTKAMQGSRENNKVMEGTIAAEILRADDADSAARVGKGRTEAGRGKEDRAIGVGLENGGGWLDAFGVAQDAGGSRGVDWCDGIVLEASIAPSEDFFDGARNSVRLGVEGKLPLCPVGCGEAVANILLPHWSGGIAVRAAVAVGLPDLGDCVVGDTVGGRSDRMAAGQRNAGREHRGRAREYGRGVVEANGAIVHVS